MNRECVAYKGQAFVIEWYFDPRGKSQSLEYYESLSSQAKKSCFIYLKE